MPISDNNTTSLMDDHSPTVETFSHAPEEAKPLIQIAKEVGTKPLAESAKEASASIAVQGAAAGSAVVGAASALSSKAQSTFATAPSSTVAPSGDAAVLQRQLADAQKEITRLQGQLKAHEVRSGTTGDSSVLLAQQISQAGQEGVPVQMVAMICFGVFVFTWSVALLPLECLN
jgi:hypothetical protein